ncbi:MAG: GNAT family N-acetyltransferase [Candidatus Aenigmarchaeota archaeon]|nr:GNAT family N-acetyltransferase [Candidatus Aenigmarchaeota archaeon]
MKKPTIRKVKPKDIDSVTRLIHNISDRDYNNSKKELWNIFRKSSYRIYRFVDSYVVELDKKIIGYGGIWSAKYDPKRFSMLDWFVVDKHHREIGIGHQLMKFLFERAVKRKIRYIYMLRLGLKTRRLSGFIRIWASSRFAKYQTIMTTTQIL